MTLGDILRNNARWYANRPAVICDGQSLTHAEFLKRANRLASGLGRLGVRHQDRVCVLAQNCIEYLEAYAAAELSGLILATVNYRLAVPEMAYIIGDAAPRVLIFEAAYADHVQAMRDKLDPGMRYVVIGEGPDWALPYETVVADGSPDGEHWQVSSDDIAYLLYTSGTTGRPKGCMLGQTNQVASAAMTSFHMRCAGEDRTLLVMPLYHVGAKNIQLAQHWAGGTVHLARSFRPAEALATIARERITVGHLAPTMVQMLLDEPGFADHDLSSLRMILYSAAPMPLPLLRDGLQRIGPVFAQIYGQTEGLGTILPIDLHRPDGDVDDLRRLASVGHPYQGARMRVVDENDIELGVGQPGELCVQSPTVMRGYWNNAPATLETLRGGWLHTGDIAEIDAEGYIHLRDRKKDVIISGGENIYSREVEAAIAEHPAVADVAVVGAADPKWGEAVTAFVLSRSPTLTEAEIIAHSRTLIAGYKSPRRVIFVEDMPRLPSGKINKLALRADLAGRVGHRPEPRPPKRGRQQR
ncbi:acyl-CoA synthetase [Novosphingobium pokkalii]|nr:acyl-CoA synthetase [Novosphingobium pokkalii]